MNIRTGLFLAALLVLSGCSRGLNWSPEFHTVRAGETVFSISKRYRLETADLVRWNRLGDGSLIYSGQRLRLRAPPGGMPAAGKSQTRKALATPSTQPPPKWLWPVKGPVLTGFGATAKTRTGVRLGGAEGATIKAAAAGDVVYAGDDLPHYGLLLIVKHNDSWLSAYGFNSRLLVSEGDSVSAGQGVAIIGEDSSGKALLHFEIRRDGYPVDPLKYLPR